MLCSASSNVAFGVRSDVCSVACPLLEAIALP